MVLETDMLYSAIMIMVVAELRVVTDTITYDIEVYEDDTEEDVRNDVYCTLQTLEYRKIPHTLHIDVKDKRCDNG